MTSNRSDLLNEALKTLVFALICFIVARAGLIFALDSSSISLIWPLAGVALAVLLLNGRRYWPGLWIGLFVSELTNASPLWLCLVVASSSTAAAVFGAYLLQERTTFQPGFGRVRDVFYFVACGVALSPAVSALIGTTSFLVAGRTSPGSYANMLFTWWIGDAIGILVVTPFLLIWGTNPLPSVTRRKLVEGAVLVVLLAPVGWIIFNQGFIPRSFYPLSYLIFPLLIWAALRFGQQMVVTLILFASLLVIVTTAQELSALRTVMLWNTVLFFWAFLATMEITAMLLAAIFSERAEMEKAARSLDERFSKAFRAAPVPIWITNVDEGRVIDINTAFSTLFGYTREEALGHTSHELQLWADDGLRPRLLEIFRREGRLTEFEITLRPMTGQPRTGLLSSEGIQLEGELHLLNMFYDLTERVGAEEALRDSEGRYRELFEGIDDAVFVHDLEANILDVNEAACRRLGYSRAELLQMKVTDLDVPGFAAEFAQRLEQFEHGQPRSIEGMQRTKDGREIYVDVNTKLITYQGRPAVLAVDRDITLRRQAEQLLRESEARYRAVVEDQTEFIARVAPDWQLLFCNEAYQRYYGKTAAELHGSYFKPEVHADDYQLVRSALKSLSVDHPLVTYEHRVRLPDGAIRWQQWTVRAITEDERTVAEYQFVGKDITEVKEMEKQRLAAALEHEKVQILADFIAAASHDFRTPLSVINTSAYLLHRATDDEQRERHFKQITEQTYHIDRLVDGLLTMSKLDRGDVFHFRAVYPNSVIRQIEARKQPQVNAKPVQLKLDLDPAVPAIDADEAWLYRGIVQFVDNAIHYTPVGGTITVRSRVETDCVVISVIDTGVGISAEDMPHIFERLYRGEGHRPVGGQGLGLPIAAKIVEGHHGRIEVESQPGHGSTFRVYLPLRRTETNAEPAPSS